MTRGGGLGETGEMWAGVRQKQLFEGLKDVPKGEVKKNHHSGGNPLALKGNRGDPERQIVLSCGRKTVEGIHGHLLGRGKEKAYRTLKRGRTPGGMRSEKEWHKQRGGETNMGGEGCALRNISGECSC